MANAPATFSESWYRVANQRLALRPTVRTRRQNFRGERWVVLEDPFSNQFFRVRPVAYEFIARLRPDRTVEEVWVEYLERFPGTALGQEAVIQLLAQLYQANLLQYQMASDASELFKRFEKTRQREIRSKLLNIMFARFPLLDPDRFLVKTLPVVGRLISPIGALIWLAVVGWALKLAADNFPSLRDQAEGVIAPGNLILLYTGLVIVKTIHEFGHAYFCRRFGGEVHTMGLMLMIFTPVPYMDATSAWGFRECWKRVLVGSAGMIAELFVAAIAMFIWANTGQGLLHNLAYNIMIVASVSTLLVNLNPLLRFDGYYILSDLTGIPNLAQRAMMQLRAMAERYLFGLRDEKGPAQTKSEATWLSLFGVSSGIYRVILFSGILLVIADKFLLIGLLMAAICAVIWIAGPVIQLIQYLATQPKLHRHRVRAIGVTLALATLTLGFLQFVPLPHHYRAPGVIQSLQWTELHTEVAGIPKSIDLSSGSKVLPVQSILQMRNPELEFQLTNARASLEEIDSRIRQATHESVPNLKPLQSLRDSAAQAIRRLEKDQERLTIKSTQTGVWVISDPKSLLGRWLPQGSPVGLVVDTNAFQFHAIIRQEDGDRIFAAPPLSAEARLAGESEKRIRLSNIRVIPGEQQNLPSPALGWHAGGPVPTSENDPSGRQAAEPFFEVQADVTDGAGASVLHGRSGWVRFDLPKEPLLPRWIRSLRQLLQKRYQV